MSRNVYEYRHYDIRYAREKKTLFFCSERAGNLNLNSKKFKIQIQFAFFVYSSFLIENEF